MTRYVVALLVALATALGLSFAATGTASASAGAPPRGYHDVCIGWSPSPGVYHPIICVEPPAT